MEQARERAAAGKVKTRPRARHTEEAATARRTRKAPEPKAPGAAGDRRRTAAAEKIRRPRTDSRAGVRVQLSAASSGLRSAAAPTGRALARGLGLPPQVSAAQVLLDCAQRPAMPASAEAKLNSVGAELTADAVRVPTTLQAPLHSYSLSETKTTSTVAESIHWVRTYTNPPIDRLSAVSFRGGLVRPNR